MDKFVKKIISFSLKNHFFVFFTTAVLVIAGVWSYFKTPLEAFPDVTNTQIILVTQWNGRSAEEVERFVSIPIEVAMNSVQRKTSVRSISMFGLSVMKIIFEDDVEDFFARQQVNNLLRNVSLPEGVEPDVQPPYGPTGEIFRYTLKSDRGTSELLAWQDWVIDRQLRAVPGVADIVSFGGSRKVFEVNVNPLLLSKYDITPLEVYDAITKSNINVGGDVIEKNGQAYVVRGIGLLESVEDIENILIEAIDDVPILVKNVASVKVGALPKVGQVGLDENDDVVEGIIVMRKGENPAQVLERVKTKIAEINGKVLPSDIKMITFYDRDKLMDYCRETVLGNLIEGILFVTIVVFIFMLDWRSTVIVSIIIPLSLLFAFMCLKLKGMSANLLSMGAIDFGIIIDGAVVMVEGLFVLLATRAKEIGMEQYNSLSKLKLVKKSASELGKAIFFSKLIIITSLVPIFSFEKVEGKLFSPLAYTLGFALLGALFFTLTLVPVLTTLLFDKNVKERHNMVVDFFNRIVSKGFTFTLANKTKTIVAVILIIGASVFSFRFLGSEFLPNLNEGALWVEAKLPMSSSINETVKFVRIFRTELNSFQEVESVLSQIGRSNDGTDPSGFFYVQCQVNLKAKKSWERNISTEELIEEMDTKLKQYPGVVYNYSQPIIDNVAEAVAGINASLAVKIFGDNLELMNSKADSIASILKTVRGVKDLGILRNIGQPELSIILNQKKMAAYGVNIADAETVIEMAIGGKTATKFFEQEKKFDVRVRYEGPYRKSEREIKELKVPSMKGNKVPLKEIAELKSVTGPAFIYRDNNKRFIAIKFSIRERDLGSTISEAQEKVNAQVTIPRGYSVAWSGEFENQVRAQNRLMEVVPICLVLIFFLLFVAFGNVKDAGLVLVNVPFAMIGGILALHVTGTIFSISAGIGFIALFGICIQNGVILISVFKKNIEGGMPMQAALIRGVEQRTRPVVMTALMAAIGLVPAAISTGIGSETQKPLAIVVIGGLISATILTLLVFPLVFERGYKRTVTARKEGIEKRTFEDYEG
jgi:cobalt-zinc-cadmium resistance protein CzcA